MTDEQKPQLPAIGGRPQAIIPTDLDSVYRLATAISKSGIAPKGMNTPEQIMVAILHGAEIGLPPMASVQRIAVINGRATIWGDAALGLIMASPAYEEHSETISGEGDERTATCIFYRKGKKPKHGTFSVADAKRAGLWSPEPVVKKKDWDTKLWVDKPNDSPWHRYPDRMLQMRARGFASRDAFPDVLGGLYLQEELEGIDAIDVTPRHGPPTEAPPPEQIWDKGPPGQLQIAQEIGNIADLPTKGSTFQPEPKQRKPRATKAEMEARRTSALALGEKIGALATFPADKTPAINEFPIAPDMNPEPPPPDESPSETQRLFPPHILSAIASYKTALSTAMDPDEIETAWAVHLSNIQSQIPKWLLDELTGLETRRAEEVE